MKSRRVALLRAVNLGGNNMVAMADLRAFALALGFTDPVTLLQSGNLVFAGASGSDADLEARLEKEAVARLNVRVDFMVRTREEWDRAIAANPFPGEARDMPAKLLMLFLKAAPEMGTLNPLRDAISGPERVELRGRELYAVYPEGQGRSKLTTNLIEKKLGRRGTGRNWNTVLKIAGLLRAGG